MAEKPTLTTSAGAPIADNQNSLTAGARGPLLIQDYQLLEKLAHQNRELASGLQHVGDVLDHVPVTEQERVERRRR